MNYQILVCEKISTMHKSIIGYVELEVKHFVLNWKQFKDEIELLSKTLMNIFTTCEMLQVILYEVFNRMKINFNIISKHLMTNFILLLLRFSVIFTSYNVWYDIMKKSSKQHYTKAF